MHRLPVDFDFQLKSCKHIYWRCVENKNQLDATEWIIALIICSTCFGDFHAHHQGLETLCVITAYGVQCVVAGCQGSGAGQQAVRPGRGMLHDDSRATSLFLDSLPAGLHLTPDNQQPRNAHHRW